MVIDQDVGWMGLSRELESCYRQGNEPIYSYHVIPYYFLQAQ